MWTYETENWKVFEPQNKADAVKFGRDAWCTARESSYHYETTYSKLYGDLYIFWKKTKSRPQYQAFIHRSSSFVELRDGGNLMVNVLTFLEEVPELTDFFKDRQLDKPSIPDLIRSRWAHYINTSEHQRIPQDFGLNIEHLHVPVPEQLDAVVPILAGPVDQVNLLDLQFIHDLSEVHTPIIGQAVFDSTDGTIKVYFGLERGWSTLYSSGSSVTPAENPCSIIDLTGTFDNATYTID